MTNQNQKTIAIISTSAVAVIGIIATVVMVVVALNNGKNGAILMSGFALIGTLVGIAAGYNAKKLKEIKMTNGFNKVGNGNGHSVGNGHKIGNGIKLKN